MHLRGTSNGEIELRVLSPAKDDLTNYLSWMRNPLSNPFILSAHEDFQAGELVDYINLLALSPNAVQFGIFCQTEGGIHVGNIKFHDIVLASREAYVGFIIGEESKRGKGLAKQAFELGAELLNQELGIQKFFLGVHKDHLHAIRAYEKMGFERVGDLGEHGLLMAYA